MRWLTGRSTEMFCHNPACAAWFGVEIGVTRATETCPEFIDTDSCPKCGEDLHEYALDTCTLQDVTEGVFHEYTDGQDVDYPALASVIARELDRQRIAHWDATRRRVKVPASRAKEADA